MTSFFTIFEEEIAKAEQRFWSNVKRGPFCWEWQAGLTEDGYGGFKLKGQSLRAHRVAYELKCGDIPEGACILHNCDNRKCVRPDHLHLGDRADNAKERVERRGR